jgi:hypothetical protein
MEAMEVKTPPEWFQFGNQDITWNQISKMIRNINLFMFFVISFFIVCYANDPKENNNIALEGNMNIFDADNCKSTETNNENNLNHARCKLGMAFSMIYDMHSNIAYNAIDSF